MEPAAERSPASAAILAGALIVALGIALFFYVAMDDPRELRPGGTVTLTFLLIVPAFLSAMVSYLSDRQATRRLRHHLLVPLALLGVVLFAGILILREGVICIVLLVPLWLPAALGGSLLTYGLRRRIRERGRLFCSAILLVPLLAAQIEARFPPEPERFSVRREVVIDASPERVWPLLVAIPGVAPEEGRWNVAQDLFGIPRPLSSALERRDGRLVRLASWEAGVRFEEHVTHWQQDRMIAWRFAFPDSSVRERTDRHIAPDGRQLRIDHGRYRLEPAAGNRTRLTLEADYVLRTPLNRYAAWWAEILLGGIQDNVLAIVKARAERPDEPRSSRSQPRGANRLSH